MKLRHCSNQPEQTKRGFTRADLCAVLMAVAVLVAIALPLLGQVRPRTEMVACNNNLRQIGVGWRLWANEQNELMPWNVKPAQGGTWGVSNTWAHFAVISNNLASPRLLACPADGEKKPAHDFSDDGNGGFAAPQFQNSALSYFVGLDATVKNTASFSSGDRGLGPNGSGTFPKENCTAVNVSAQTLNATTGAAWKSTNSHSGVGNLLWTHGGASQTTSTELQSAANGALGAGLQIHLLFP